MRVFFLGKCVRTDAETMVVDRRNRKALPLLYLASGQMINAANSSDEQTELAEHNKDEVLEGKFLNFSPFTKKTTEYSVKRFLSVY